MFLCVCVCEFINRYHADGIIIVIIKSIEFMLKRALPKEGIYGFGCEEIWELDWYYFDW